MPPSKNGSIDPKSLSEMDENGSFCTLCRRFAIQSSAHGLKRAATARSTYTRIFWVVVFFLALTGCTFHCSFLIKTYLSYPRMTITEEIHADEISFPSITVCNLNVFKKSYIENQLEILQMQLDKNNSNDTRQTAFCYKSVDEFLKRSKTIDLSDIWMSLTVTKDSLLKFGHQEEDLIIHCTYNARNCYNTTHTIVFINAYPSPRYGLCHTISVNQISLQNVTTPGLALDVVEIYHGDYWLEVENDPSKERNSGPSAGKKMAASTAISGKVQWCHYLNLYKSVRAECNWPISDGQQQANIGLRLTLNIQRDEYLDLLSPEYGARLLVHPPGTYPTLQRGGVVLQPGTKTYVSVRMRMIDRLPWPYGECTDRFEDSPLSFHLQRTGQKDLLKHRIYTYEYCQTLCRDAFLLKQCDCSEEVSEGNSRFCDPCNDTQTLCRTDFLRRFNRNPRSRECHKFCKPACSDIRYDLTISRSEWPNKRHHFFVLKRWNDTREKFGSMASEGNYSGNGEGNVSLPVDLVHLRSNFMRVHVFIQEMNYLSVKDVPAYSTSQLFADLGGCLGLYIGVSLITILEVFELFKSIVFIIRSKFQSKFKCQNDKESGIVELRWVSTPPIRPFPVLYRRNKNSKACCPGISIPQTSSNRNVTYLNPRCVSPLRQLPSPIFLKDVDNYGSNYSPY